MNLTVHRQPKSPAGRLHAILACTFILLLATACSARLPEQEMANQPRCEPLETSAFFEDGKCARDPVEGTVARESLDTTQLFEAGLVGDQEFEEFPIPVTQEFVGYGQERYNIYCSMCHGYAGYGNGMIVQRGFPPPPSLHEARLIDVPDSYLYNVITNGIGVMYPYASRVPSADRWAIVAYIRALQVSQNATVEDVPLEERSALEEAIQ